MSRLHFLGKSKVARASERAARRAGLWGMRRLGLEPLEDRRLLAVTLTWTGAGKALTLAEGTTGDTPAIVISETTSKLLKIDLGAGHSFASDSTASATGLTYQHPGVPATSQYATIDVSAPKNISALTATLPGDDLVLSAIENLYNGVGSVTASADNIQVGHIDTAAVNGKVDLKATANLTIQDGTVVLSGTGTISLAADVKADGTGDDGTGTLAIGAGAIVASANVSTSAMTLRGADIEINATALVGALPAQSQFPGATSPQALIFDASGKLYVANDSSGSDSVLKFAPWSTSADELTGVISPRALAFDSSGNLYVANANTSTVSKFAPGSSTPIATLTGLSIPSALAFDSSGNLYVANWGGGTVSKFAAGSTTPSATLTGLSFPQALAFDSSGNLYVANSSSSTVSKFASGSTTASAVLTGLNAPQALAFDNAGNLYVANRGNNTVSKFTPGSTTAGETLTGVTSPQALICDGNSNLYVASVGDNSVSKFNYGETTSALRITGLNHPQALAIDASGNLYVANAGTGANDGSVSKFEGQTLSTPTALIDPLAGGVIIRSSQTSRGMSFGGANDAVAGVNLTDAELARIHTTAIGKVTVGDTGQTGDITFTTATMASTAGASTSVIQSGAGTIVLDDAQIGTGLDGNGGRVTLTPGTGGIVAYVSAGGASLTTAGFTATNLTLVPTLTSKPIIGTKLTVVDNTSITSIRGVFVNLPANGLVSASYGGATYHFIVSYGDGNGNDLVLTAVNDTTTTVIAAPNPSNKGTSVSFTATVVSAGNPVTVGTVTFKEGSTLLSTTLLDGNGHATFSTDTLVVGSHTITAYYDGTESYAASSKSVTEVVLVPATTTVATAAPSPSAYDVLVTFTAAVFSAGAPVTAGTVTFKEGKTSLKTIALDPSGEAKYSTDTLPVGIHTITAYYNGTTDFSASSQSVTQTVNPSNYSALPGLYDPATSTFHLYNSARPAAPDASFTLAQAGAGATPLSGDWNGDGAAGVGLYAPKTSTFYLVNQPSSTADFTFGYGAPGGGWIPLVGDWNGDGKMGVGLYDPVASTFYLTNNLKTGIAQYTFGYGEPSAGWIPLVGDWNGDGKAGVGLYDPTSSTFFLTDTLSIGTAEHTFGYGVPKGGWKPFVGDWNGDGAAGVGLYDPKTSMFYLTNQHTPGYAEYSFGYGTANRGWTPLVGDWDGDKATGVGLYDPSGSVFYLTDTLSTGIAEKTIPFGPADGGWVPLNGCWPQGTLALHAESVGQSDAAATAIDASTLRPIVQEAIARWAATGIAGQTLDAMQHTEFVVGSLPGAELGLAAGRTVYLDDTAAGHGWFVDPTPAQDEEFATQNAGGQLRAVDARAVDRLDLLTVVEHELGHIAGLDDLEPALQSLMSATLGAGIRRNP